MSLSLSVRINRSESLAIVEVTRTSHVDVDSLPADTVVAYDVVLHTRRDDDTANPLTPQRAVPLQHRYGDGALVLAAAAAAAVLPGGTA